MNKNMYLIGLLCINFGMQAKLDPDRPLAQPSQKLSTFKNLIRNVTDFLGTEYLGCRTLNKQNEDYIQSQINVLKMDDYCIEIRGMSNHAQRLFGRINAFVMPSIIFNKKSHAYLFVSEEWFESLPDQQKEALVRHELMHLKFDHIHKRLCLVLASLVGVKLMTGTFNMILKHNFPNLPQDDQRLFIARKAFGYVIGLTSLLIQRNYSRACEKEADIQAAKTVENKQGFIDLFNNFKDNKDPKSRFAIKRFFKRLFKPVSSLFRTHPTHNERIAYIKNLK